MRQLCSFEFHIVGREVFSPLLPSEDLAPPYLRGEAEFRGEGRDCLEPVRRRVNPQAGSFREDELQGAIAQSAAGLEIAPVGGDECGFGRQLGERHQRGVGGIHQRVFEHDLLGAGEMLGPRSREDERAFSHQIEQRVSRLGVAAEMPARFAEHDLRGVQRAAARGESRHAPLVPLVGGVQPADERAGINDGLYFHSLRGSKDRGGL